MERLEFAALLVDDGFIDPSCVSRTGTWFVDINDPYITVWCDDMVNAPFHNCPDGGSSGISIWQKCL